jgi:hypothetical protein
MSREPIFIVTDGEFDGPIPGRNSMLSFASVAVTPAGEQLGEFEATLETLEGSQPEPETMAFWETAPAAYAAGNSSAATWPRPVGRTAWRQTVPNC